MEEGLQGPIINPYWFGEEYMDHVESSSEKAREALGLVGYRHLVVNTDQRLSFEEEEEEEKEEEDDDDDREPQYLRCAQTTTLEEEDTTMPFLQMLQSSVESPSVPLFKEPSFQLLMRLQHLKTPWLQTQHNNIPQKLMVETQESCMTHDTTAAPETSLVELGGSESPERRRKRKRRGRQGGGKNKEEVESQRMTHIAVERNRRRQMNDHLNSLRSLMPPSYVQRGDQASIVGGAIDFVKELEQLLESLEAQKRMSKLLAQGGGGGDTLSTSSSSSSCSSSSAAAGGGGGVGVVEVVKVKVVVIQNHVNLKIECDENRPGQLLKAIAALEHLRLTVLHLNITTFQTSSSSSSSNSVHYSFNLKVEDDCRVGSAGEIERSVHGIFNGSR